MQTEKIQFSVVIPTFNPDFKIFETLKNVKKSILYFQEKSKITFEILIINDGGKEIEDKIVKVVENSRVFDLKQKQRAWVC